MITVCDDDLAVVLIPHQQNRRQLLLVLDFPAVFLDVGIADPGNDNPEALNMSLALNRVTGEAFSLPVIAFTVFVSYSRLRYDAAAGEPFPPAPATI